MERSNCWRHTGRHRAGKPLVEAGHKFHGLATFLPPETWIKKGHEGEAVLRTDDDIESEWLYSNEQHITSRSADFPKRTFKFNKSILPTQEQADSIDLKALHGFEYCKKNSNKLCRCKGCNY